jgi:hypothetical protein
MADNIPNLPSGALPPKPETSKIQPKKETVRINLPPKPSAAPTIKLPTLPPGGPSTSSLGPSPLPPPPTSSGARAAAPAPPTSQRSAPQQRPAAQAQRQVTAPKVSSLDVGLAIAAAVVALAAVGATAYLTWGGVFTPSPGQ